VATPAPTSAPRPHLRRGALAAVGLGVLAGHALVLLDLWPQPPAPGTAGDARARAVQVRRIALPSAARVAVPAAPALGKSAAPAARPRAVQAGAAAPVVAPVASAAEAGPAPGAAPPPVYATQLPPAVTLHYELRRGAARSRAELQWRPAGNGYELALRSEGAGGAALGAASQGGFDASGLAPERHTESRRGRDLRAANFQREAGRITFSGPTIDYPLVPGAQDRLSWMVQLAGVLAANPALALPGSEVLMFVAGTRGDGEVWTFKVIEMAEVELANGTVLHTAVHLQREPRRPYDTQVDVWLDPARRYLPVRTRLVVRATGEGTELLLAAMIWP
jgi:hypothetical protein